MALVKSKVAHIQPGTLAYREEGEEFELEGKLYKHVEVIKRRTPQTAEEAAPEETEPELVTKKSIR